MKRLKRLFKAITYVLWMLVQQRQLAEVVNTSKDSAEMDSAVYRGSRYGD